MKIAVMKEKCKKYIEDHKVEVAYLAGSAISTASIIVTMILSDRYEQSKANVKRLDNIDKWNAWSDRLDDLIEEQDAAGNKVYLLHDYSVVTMPEDTPTEWIKKI